MYEDVIANSRNAHANTNHKSFIGNSRASRDHGSVGDLSITNVLIAVHHRLN